MKNIYITDLDHTFLRTDLSISDYTKTIWNAKSKNSIMGVATARTFNKAEQFLKSININTPLILLDGALVATSDKKIIDTKFITKEIADMVIDEGAKMHIYPFILSLENKELNEAFLHSNILNKYQEEVLAHYVYGDNLQERKNLRAMNENFKIVYMGEEESLRELGLVFEKIFGDILTVVLAPEAYLDCYLLTLLHKDADKSHGIKIVSEYSGFDLLELTVFGDNFNDLGMFSLAGTSVAVANAQPEVKAEASFISKYTNNEDAVARYLESFRT